MRLFNCPNCNKSLEVTEIYCSACDLKLHGHFDQGCKFCTLDSEQQKLLDVFLSCRGVIRDMEKVLNVSYPTVRARLDALLSSLGYTPIKIESKEELAARRSDILSRLEAGEISADEAETALKLVGR